MYTILLISIVSISAQLISTSYLDNSTGSWELMPIAKDLEESSTFYTAFIDDYPGEKDATMDMFLFQPELEIAWWLLYRIKTIRGASLEDKPTYIPDSLHKVAKVVYYDYDEYPDLLIIPPVLSN